MDSTLACLAAWMPRQRWYAAKGRPPSLRLISWWDLAPVAAEDAGARIRTYLVADEGAFPAVLYQLPVVSRATETVDALPAHIIGDPEPGTTFIDGPFDPAYARALIRLVTLGGTGEGPRTVATGHPALDAPPDEPRSASVVTGEQSNTSLIYRCSGVPIICKVYRQLHPGLNPDIELPTALAEAGSIHVPRAIGWIEGAWPDPATAQGTVRGPWPRRRSSFRTWRTPGGSPCTRPLAARTSARRPGLSGRPQPRCTCRWPSSSRPARRSPRIARPLRRPGTAG
nr:hypothetical protein GCM10025699_31890 [Microbacterium flavescens]